MLRSPPVQNWVEPDACPPLMVFAQRLEEALFDYTMDSFRAPALTSLGRANELAAVTQDCMRGSAREEALRPVYEELCHSLRGDEAAKAVLEDLGTIYTDKRLWSSASPEDLHSHAEILMLRLGEGRYRDALKERIRAAIRDGEVGAVDAYAPALAVELMRQGYSREYIFYSTREFFFKRHQTTEPIEGPDAFEGFLSFLHRDEADWTVYLLASECLSVVSSFFRGDDFSVGTIMPEVEADQSQVQEWLDRSLDDRVIFRLEEKGFRDAQAAHLRARRFMELMAQYVRYSYHRHPVVIEAEALVVASDGSTVVLRAPKPATEKRPEPHRTGLDESVKSTFLALGPRTLRGESTQRFLASLQMHGTAVLADTQEAQLLGLWTALESFLPLVKADAGIRRLLQLAVPILSVGYPGKILANLLLATRKTARGSLDAVLELAVAPALEEDIERFVALLFDPDLRDGREELLRIVGHNHLLRFRLESYGRRFATGGGILEAVEDHYQRVEWHLNRIYRARNRLVHEGALDPQVGPLIENLHDYYHQILDNVAGAYAKYERPISIEAVVAGIGASYSAYLEGLRRASVEPVTHANARTLLWGIDM